MHRQGSDTNVLGTIGAFWNSRQIFQ